MTHCENCHCYLGTQKAVQHHLEQVHGVHLTLNENLCYCKDCHVYMGHSPVCETTRRALEKHLRTKHFVDIHGHSVFLYEEE
jgi:hypothetical protein